MEAKSKFKLSEIFKTRLFVGVATFCLVVSTVLVGGRTVLAATDSRAEDAMNEAVVLYALEHPDSKMAMILAEYLLVSEQNVLAGLRENSEVQLGVIKNQENQVRTERVCSKYADSNFKYSCAGWGRLTLPTTTTTVSEVNRLGIDAVVEYAEVQLTGTVSSTFNIYVGISTSTYVGYAATAGSAVNARPANLIDGYQVVTTTIPLGSPNTFLSLKSLITNKEDQGTNGRDAMPFASSSAFVVFLQNQVGGTAGSCPGTGACESVTSTNRGTLDGSIRYRFRYEIDL